ncbi:Hsp33 family molecular chaperone HslO [Roseateles terrae]|uniref:Molecular chaperone Hsp33 n=1 Tax=Roseateles terrae TaxID=431060 RepID=A0ABR6GQC6_9BURK|nr:Hsp33 family molecular chaperone HslO [Roseateles terrae]MBB3193439.1 molecular chaperone Hsp33 [Roseateles terrae]OWQ89376.1 redox-regulated molecular chaperone Hsp33 [Roseateles terrae]
MSELHKFLFEGLPVRGMLVRLDSSWKELLSRRKEPLPSAVRDLVGQMAAAGVLMQANIKFSGALIFQVMGDGPLKLAVAEVQPDMSFRATAKTRDDVPDDATLQQMLNAHGQGRCAITLDPKDRLPGQQPYQGLVSLVGPEGEPLNKLSDVLQHYMRQSEQLDSTLVLAANDQRAAGLLIQRLPIEGEGNLEAGASSGVERELMEDAYNRISMLAATLTNEELLTLDSDTILRRLFWEENVRRFEPQTPHFACTCSRERVGRMLLGLGRKEVDEILAELGGVEIGCEFCGNHYKFDAVDVGELFTDPQKQAPGSEQIQ